MITGAVLNATTDGYAAQLDIHNNTNGYQVLVPAEFPPPQPKPAYATSYDTEGSIATEEAHYENRTISLKVRVFGTTAANYETRLNALYKMVGQINREGGSLKITTPNNTVCYFDLVPEATATAAVDKSWQTKLYTIVDLQLVARPFWRGAEVSYSTRSETTLPALIFTETGPDGDVPALGRLVVTDATGANQWTGIVAGESRYYNPSTAATTSALFLQAEDLTPLGASTDTAGAAGASGTNVIRNTDLTTTYQAILKSEIDSSNLALTHKGTFRIWARLYRPTGNSGAVSVRLEWAEGDYTRVALNDPVVYRANEREGAFTWANLGPVNISPASNRWEFRLLAKSTVAGDEIDADCFVLFPTEVVYTELAGIARFLTPSSFSARDEFDQSPGALSGKTLPIGGTWSGAGDADDFSVVAADEDESTRARRTAVSDANLNSGRYGIAGSTDYTNVVVQADVWINNVAGSADEDTYLGVLARYTDTNNWLMAVIEPRDEGFHIRKRVSGTVTTIETVTGLRVEDGVPWSIRLMVDTTGRWWAYCFAVGTTPTAPLASGQDAALATGGALATGKPGIYDAHTKLSALNRNYDNFIVFVPTLDAAIFASQSLTLSHAGASREDSTGTFSAPVSSVRGRYLKIPPGGPEGRSTRLIVKGFRYDPYTSPDGGIDDISAQLHVTPRGLVVPEA